LGRGEWLEIFETKYVENNRMSVHVVNDVLVNPWLPLISVGHACQIRPSARNQTLSDYWAMKIEFWTIVERWTSSFERFVGRRRGRRGGRSK